MESSLREYVREQITAYSDNVKKYFESLALVAEQATMDEANNPEQILKQMAAVDGNLQKAIEHSKCLYFKITLSVLCTYIELILSILNCFFFLVQNHQLRQQQIIQVQDEIQHHNIALLEIIQKLGSAREELDLSLTQAKVELKAIKYATDCKLLAYTQKGKKKFEILMIIFV